VRRAGQLTGHGDDLFFLELPETIDLLRGEPAPLAKVPARRASYETYQELPPYPALVHGRAGSQGLSSRCGGQAAALL
jgi:pyruvate,water dikinase